MSNSFRRAVDEARKILQELRIRHPSEINIELLAIRLGAYVDYRHLSNEEGHLLRTNEQGLIVVDEKAKHTKKWRFVIAHELGHFRLHGHTDQLQLCTDRHLHQWYRESGLEPEANAFAAELLMPTEMFEPLCDVARPSLSKVKELADLFQTSLTATALRFVKFCPEPCSIAYSTNGKIDWWGASEGFAFTLKRGSRLTTETFAGDLFAGHDVDDELLPLNDASAWSGDSRAVGFELYEHSIKLESYDAVLSLLWHPYQDEDEVEY